MADHAKHKGKKKKVKRKSKRNLVHDISAGFSKPNNKLDKAKKKKGKK